MEVFKVGRVIAERCLPGQGGWLRTPVMPNASNYGSTQANSRRERDNVFVAANAMPYSIINALLLLF
jgi:hypothetical protein